MVSHSPHPHAAPQDTGLGTMGTGRELARSQVTPGADIPSPVAALAPCPPSGPSSASALTPTRSHQAPVRSGTAGAGPQEPPKRVFSLMGPGRETKALQLPPFLADLLPDTVLRGVLQGLYIPLSCGPHQAAPRAPSLPGS